MCYCYIRQVNEVNSRDTVFFRCLCAADLSIRPVWGLNANSSKTVNASLRIFHIARAPKRTIQT